jgi:hypothetical protein
METPRTESELREFYQDFSTSSLNFGINLNKFLRFFCTEFGLFLMYFVILAIPMALYYVRVLQHPLFFGFLFVALQGGCYAWSIRNPEKLQNDIAECDLKINVFRKLIAERNNN